MSSSANGRTTTGCTRLMMVGSSCSGAWVTSRKMVAGRRLFQQLEHGVGGSGVHELGQPENHDFEARFEGFQAHQL